MGSGKQWLQFMRVLKPRMTAVQQTWKIITSPDWNRGQRAPRRGVQRRMGGWRGFFFNICYAGGLKKKSLIKMNTSQK